MKAEFPDMEYGWTEDGKTYYVCQDEGEYYRNTFYFVFQNGRLWSESLMVESTGVIPNAGYIWFLTMAKKFYTQKNWRHCDVDASIIRAASIFNSEHRVEWADKFEAELNYSNFMIFLKYNPEKKNSTISYFITGE